MSLLPNEVKSEHIARNAVTTPKIADEAVTSAKINDGSVKTEKLATNAVTGSKLAANAVTGSKIRDNTVRTEKIAVGAITSSKIGAQQVTGSRIKDRTITSDKLANSAVTTTKIANASVTKAKLSFTLPPPGGDGITRPITPPVATEEIADGSVTADKLATDSVTQTKIARNTVGWSEIREQSLEPEQIKTLSGEPATEGQIPVADLSQDNQWWFRWADPATRPLTPPISADEIGELQVTGSKLQDGSVTQSKLDPALSLGERITYLATRQNILSLYDVSAEIPWTDIDLSTLVPEGTRGVLLHVEVEIVAIAKDNLADFKLRRDDVQDVSMLIRASGEVAGDLRSANGIMGITANRRIQYAATGIFYFPRISVNVYALGYIV